MIMNPEIFREYDIRGVVDKDFDVAFAHKLGQTFVTYVIQKTGVKNPKLTLGYDARVSSPGISKALSEGMQSGGAHIVQLGMVTTPLSYFSMFDVKDCHGGIMVTGSHNPPDYNGFKVSLGKTTIFGDEIQVLRQIMEKGQFAEGNGDSSTYDIFPSYLARYKKEFGAMKDIGVVLDCGNGAAGVVARRLYEELGLKPEILFEEPDGRFPNHHPDPTVEKKRGRFEKSRRCKKGKSRHRL